MFLFMHAQGLIKLWLSACFVILLKRKIFQSIVKKTIVDITIRRQLICVFSGMLMGLFKIKLLSFVNSIVKYLYEVSFLPQ